MNLKSKVFYYYYDLYLLLYLDLIENKLNCINNNNNNIIRPCNYITFKGYCEVI